ncbi:glucose-6-phosphate isomerase [Rivibacter subsaxonicus]|uniref:Glucose-6-phosphate isomerase n=1 Tax=Rivibacter subsaxonicus TaxID=457575 RepID=A0A4Q7V6H1_9BURK|nr:glucose-6-phosphate isomerase [Rivibacter subsaxonicus]RZT91915.1 glucose-6-phosphate isomerase [Rivibacter subsaxonicus]
MIFETHPPLRAHRAAVWQSLREHFAATGSAPMSALFDADAQRFERFSLEAAGLFLDYSKNRLDERALSLLIALADASGLPAKRAALFDGATINLTEGRAALHTALRAPAAIAAESVGEPGAAEIAAVRARCADFAGRVRSGAWRGHTGERITDVVNLGIGGSDLGPRMVVDALRPFCVELPRLHFVANIDGAELDDVLQRLDPATTLFIVASKTFTTIETLTNARSARRWLLASGASQADVARHFVAVSTNAQAVAEFGIAAENMFGFWDWVGGRYSLWSAIGLPIMIAIGPARFDELLAGAHAMDEHFRHAPAHANMPVLLALVGIWYRNFGATASHAVIPYSQHLQRLPAYLQQLEMESNGKSVSIDGEVLAHASCPVVWGEPGTNGQHAFFQLLHQGSDLIPIDFIAAVEASHGLHEHQRLLLANCIAQGSALMHGKDEGTVRTELAAQGLDANTIERVARHRGFAGNRPSNTLLLKKLDPPALGALIALYEHKVFVQSVVWNVNAFDQFGVELGKVVARRIDDALRAGSVPQGLDGSTSGLMARVLERQG